MLKLPLKSNAFVLDVNHYERPSKALSFRVIHKYSTHLNIQLLTSFSAVHCVNFRQPFNILIAAFRLSNFVLNINSRSVFVHAIYFI